MDTDPLSRNYIQNTCNQKSRFWVNFWCNSKGENTNDKLLQNSRWEYYAH